jgi:Cof subfamily protein (haloacid dehalogenase superfamily)
MNQPMKLLACDIDGTLADDHGVISDESMAAINRVRAQGVLLVPATGRMPNTIDHFLDRLEITTEPIIAAQGALVTHRNGAVLRRLTIDRALIREGAAIGRQHGAAIAYFTEHELIMDRSALNPLQDAAWMGSNLRYESDPLAHLNGDLIKIIAYHPDPGAVPDLLADMQARLGTRADVTRSHRWFVEVCAPGADKGSALAWLCGTLGVGRDEVLAIGDGGNDVSMLRWAGMSAAPASGDPDAIAAAKWTAPPIAEHPVVATLAHFGKQ